MKHLEFSDAHYLNEASTIGNYIVRSAIKNESGFYWKFKDTRGEISENTSMYNGSSGILIYLFELYRKTEDEVFYETFISGCDYLLGYEYTKEEKNLSIYCGLGGMIYVLLIAYDLTGVEAYKNRCIEIAKDCCLSNTQYYHSEILSGIGGSIITLLHLHIVIQETWVLDSINEHIRELLKDVIVTKNGVCWDRSGNSIHPLCGFSHGASGIGYVFLELYKYFNNECFYIIAEKAFGYEDGFIKFESALNDRGSNWPDFRKNKYLSLSIDDSVESVLLEDVHSLFVPSYVTAWCHGAPGIGMARSYAYMLTRKESHIKFINNSLNCTRHSFNFDSIDCSLCHGRFGNLSLFLDASIALDKTEYYAVARKETDKYLSMLPNNSNFEILKSASTYDCSLFLGIAGVGHFLLRLLDPIGVQSMLLPGPRNIKNKYTNSGLFDDAYFYSLFYSKICPNTFLETLPSEFLDNEYWKKSRQELIAAIGEFVNKSNSTSVMSSYTLDLFITQLSDNIQSDCYVNLLNNILSKKNRQINYKNVTDSYKNGLILNSTITLKKQKFNGYTAYFILQISPNNDPVRQFSIGEFTFELLSTYKQLTSIYESLEYMRSIYQKGNLKSQFEKIFYSRLVVCLQASFLIDANLYFKLIEAKVYSRHPL